MAREKIITGLDIGSYSVKTIIAKKTGNDERLQIIGVGMAPSLGIRKGVIVDIDEAVSSIKSSIAEAERLAGVEVGSVAANLSGAHISSKISKGVVAVSRADQEISEDDISRVISAAEAISVPLNKEILHALPQEFVIDSERGIKDPLGMHGVRLELNALIVECSTPVLKNVGKAIESAGLGVENIVLSPIASAYSSLTKRQKELGVLVLDIGSATTGFAVYEDGNIIHVQILPIGSGHITNDIAIGLRTDIDTAERVKLEYGACNSEDISKKDMIDMTKVASDGRGQASKKEISEIIEARLEEIFDLANKELKRIGKQGLLPAGVVLVGGGSKLPGIAEFAKKILKLPVQIGTPCEINGMVDYINDPSFAGVVGLIKWSNDSLGGGALGARKKMRIASGGFFAKIKRIFSALMP